MCGEGGSDGASGVSGTGAVDVGGECLGLDAGASRGSCDPVVLGGSQ